MAFGQQATTSPKPPITVDRMQKVQLLGGVPASVASSTRAARPANVKFAPRDVPAPTNTFSKFKFDTKVFDDDDPLGFSAIKELQSNSVTKVQLRDAIMAEGFARGGASLDKTVMVYSDGTRIETVIPVVDGCLDTNTVVVLEDGTESNFVQNYKENLVAFYGGTNITSLGQSVLGGCGSLVEIICPSVTNIGHQALMMNPNLVAVSFPQAKTLGIYAFLQDYALSVVDMPTLECLDVHQAPSGDELGNHFRQCTSLKTIFLPNLVEIRGPGVFYGCTALEKVYIPAATNITQGMFWFCPELSHVDVSSVQTVDNSIYEYVYVDGDWQLADIHKTVDITDDIEYGNVYPRDGTWFYYDCFTPFSDSPKVKKLEFRKMEKVADRMFPLYVVEEFSFKSATEVGNRPFKQCSDLKKVEFGSLLDIPTNMLSGSVTIEEITFDEATVVGEYAFANCSNLKTVNLPKAQTIGTNSFSNCSSLRTLELPSATVVQKEAFMQCQSLISANLPSAVEIQENAFRTCKNLRTVNMPFVRTIGEYGFHSSGIQVLNAPSLQTIEREACYNCKSLYRAMMPELTTCGKRVFVLCSALKHFSAPKLKSCDFEVFKQTGLETVYWPGVEDLAAELHQPNNINASFAFCPHLREIELPDAKIIGSQLFQGTDGLRTAVFPKCEELWRAAFHDCHSIEEVYFCRGNVGVTNVVKLVTSTNMPLDIFWNVNHPVNIIVPDNLYGRWSKDATWLSQNVNIYSQSGYKPVRNGNYYKQSVVADEINSTNLVFSLSQTRTFTFT